MESPDTVVLLHGLGRTHRSMLGVHFWLHRAGYRVVRLGYPSLHATLDEIVQRHISPGLASLRLGEGGRVHFVTHSLGGIVFRAWARTRAADFPLGRSVLLAPPNQGSEIIDHVKHWPVVKDALGPVARNLGTDAESIPNTLGPVPPGTGVIMGNHASWPFRFFNKWVGPSSDGVVTIEGGRVPGVEDFAVLHADHGIIAWHPKVLDAVVRYLDTGRFHPDSMEAA